MTRSPLVRVLLVDDDPLMRAVLSRFLQGRGWDVAQAENGAEALQRVREDGVYNLVITDRHMPEMDGLQLCRAIRALPSKHYVYCIMLTASSEEKSLVAAMEAGVDDFVAKPVQMGELGARLHAAERVLALQAGLAARNEKLAEAYERLRQELDLARSLQSSQIPPAAAYGNARFDGLLIPSSFVGGDMFDYFRVDDRHVAFHVIDVSGHGVAAAMLAFNAQRQLQAASQEIAALHLRDRGALAGVAVRVATEANRRFQQMKDTSLYLTLVFGVLDVETGDIGIVRAGHPAPLLSRAAGQFEEVGAAGVPVGILDDPQYEATTLRLERGARLVLYSDGITECESPDGEPFGEQRFRQLLAEAHGQRMSALTDALRTNLGSWHGGESFEDDVTCLVVEMK